MNRLKKIIPTSEFSQHVTTLMLGQLFVHFISFAALPLITSLYSVEQIGLYSLFISIFMVLTVISTGRYESAIVVEQDKQNSIVLWCLSLVFSVIFSILLFVFLLIFKHFSPISFKINLLGDYIYLLPIIVFLGALNRATQFYFNKLEQYKKISISDILKSGTNAVGSISFGFLKFLSGGLIVANIFAVLLSTMYLLVKLPSFFWKNFSTNFSYLKLKEMGLKYKQYLSYYSLSGILSTLVTNGTPIFIIFFFTEKTAGYYFMAEKVISIPLGLVVAAISKVFYQRATVLYNTDKNKFLQLIQNIQKKMIFVLVPLLLILSLIAPYFFDWFGNDWRRAGEMIKYFAILVFFKNLVSPVGSISNIINRLDVLLYFNIALALAQALSFYVGSLYLSFENTLLFSSLVLSVCYIVLDFYLKKLIRNELK